MGPTYKLNEYSNRKKIDDMTLIWLDKCISRTAENYYSMNRLCNLIHNIHTFSRIDTFIEYLINEINEQIILIVSGSLGYDILPKIHSYPLIESIYIFCQNKTKHQLWAKNFKKIQGVFNDIDLLCLHLRKMKLFQPNYNYNSINKTSSSDKLSPFIFIENIKIESDYQIEQIKDEFLSYYTENQALPVLDMSDQDSSEDKNENIDSYLIYFSSSDNAGKVDLDDCIEQSNTVIPYIQTIDQKYLNNGVWPSLWWIIKNENNLFKMITFNKIRHFILNTNIIENIDLYFKYLNKNFNEKHFIVICDVDNLEEYLPFICQQEHVYRIYLYSSLNNLNQYKTIIKRFSKIILILQHSDTLIHMILHDFLFYSIKLAEYYKKEKKNNLAKIQYEYALHLQSNIQLFIKERIKLINQN